MICLHISQQDIPDCRLIQDSLNIEHQYGARMTATFAIELLSDDAPWPRIPDPYPHFEQGDCVYIVDEPAGGGQTLLFYGFIDTYTEVPGQSSLKYSFSCVDLHQCADKRIDSAVFVSTTTGDIVRDLITRKLGDENVEAAPVVIGKVTYGNIVDADTNSLYQYRDKKVSDVLDDLAERNACVWWIQPMIDTSKGFVIRRILCFISKAYTSTVWPLTRGTFMKDSLTLTRGNKDYRNRQTVAGAWYNVGELEDDCIQPASPANNREFLLSYAVAEVPKQEGDETGDPNSSILVNGVVPYFDPAVYTDTVGHWGEKNDADEPKKYLFYWTEHSRVIVHDPDQKPLAAGAVLTVKYRGEKQARATVNPTDINPGNWSEQYNLGQRESGSGIVEVITEDDAVKDDETAKANAILALKTYCEDVRKVTFKTWLPGVCIGGPYIRVNITELGFLGREQTSGSPPVPVAPDMNDGSGLDDFLVESVTITREQGDTYWQVSAIKSPISEPWEAFFVRSRSGGDTEGSSAPATPAAVVSPGGDRNVDGGDVDDVYLPVQTVDGGDI